MINKHFAKENQLQFEKMDDFFNLKIQFFNIKFGIQEKAKIPEEKAEKPSQGDDYNLQVIT